MSKFDGADDLADHDPVAREARAARDVRQREAGRDAARAVRADRLRPRVEVQQVVVRDQLELDRQVVLVDLADAVDQRDLRRGHVGRAAVVGRVARIGDQREPVGAQHVAGRRVGRRVVVADDLVARRRRVVAARVARLDDVRLEVAVRDRRRSVFSNVPESSDFTLIVRDRRSCSSGSEIVIVIRRLVREAAAGQRARRRPRGSSPCRPRARRRSRRARRTRSSPCPRRRRHVVAEVRGVDALVEVVVGIDVPVARRRADGRVEAERAHVGVDRGLRVVDAPAAEGRDLGMLRREAGRHDVRLAEHEALEAALRVGQRDDEPGLLRARLPGRRAGAGCEQRLEARLVELERVELRRPHVGLGAVVRGRAAVSETALQRLLPGLAGCSAAACGGEHHSRPARHPARAPRSRSRCACRAPVSARVPAARSPSSHPLGPCRVGSRTRPPASFASLRALRAAGDPLWQPRQVKRCTACGSGPGARRALGRGGARRRRRRAAWPRRRLPLGRRGRLLGAAVVVFFAGVTSSASERLTRFSSAFTRSSSSATSSSSRSTLSLRSLRPAAPTSRCRSDASLPSASSLSEASCEITDFAVHRCLLYPFDALTIRVPPAARIASSDRDRRAPRPRRLLRRRGGAREPRAARAAARRRRRPARPRRRRDGELRGAAVRHLLGDVVRRGAAALPDGDLRPAAACRSTASTRRRSGRSCARSCRPSSRPGSTRAISTSARSRRRSTTPARSPSRCRP